MKLTLRHLLLCIVTSIPVWWVVNSYITPFHLSKAVATGITLCFFGLVFTGRYLALIWESRKYRVTDSLFIVLAILVGTNLIWLFIHSDFPIHNLPAINILLYWIPFFIFGIALGMLIKIIRLNQKHLMRSDVSAMQSKSELQLLQSQLSPHFLFNTLNNLYGLSITKHEKIPPLLLKLSELLRYSVYEAKETFVPLQDEINYIKNYIEFEKIRLGERLQLHVSLQEGTDLLIAPMMLIIFIENAFKHSKESTDQNIYIMMHLETNQDAILFSISNSYQLNGTKLKTEKNSGFGLDNVKKRLLLLYPGRHNLKIQSEPDRYTVHLQIKTRKNESV